MSKQRPAESSPLPNTGLAALLAVAQPGEHGILADWVQEHLQLDDLAACLRAGSDDPRSPVQAERTAFHHFRYRFLDRHVLLYACYFRVWAPYQAGQPPQEEPEGYLLGLCLSPHIASGPTRIVRWFLHQQKDAALTRLWQDLAKNRPLEEGEV